MLDPKVELDKLVAVLETDVPSLGLSELEEEKLIELSDSTELAFCSVVGSWNYGLAGENSDVDFKVTYLPSFRHFYDNKFPKMNVVGKDVDFTVAPFNQYVEHILKGNINFFEVLYTDDPWFHTKYDEVHVIKVILRAMIPMNAVRMRNACMGTAAQKMKGLHKYSIDNKDMEEKFGYNLKEAAHAVRQLGFLVNFMVKAGNVELRDHELMNHVKMIKRGQYTESMVVELYENTVKLLEEPWHKNKFEQLDETETPKWEELKENLEEQVYALCWKKSL